MKSMFIVFVVFLNACASGPGETYEKTMYGITYYHVHGERPRLDIPLPSGIKIKPKIYDGDSIVYITWQRKITSDWHFAPLKKMEVIKQPEVDQIVRDPNEPVLLSDYNKPETKIRKPVPVPVENLDFLTPPEVNQNLVAENYKYNYEN